MDIELIAFLAASIVIIVVPGVDFALITRQVIGYGRRAGFITLIGLVTGGLVHTALTTAGLSVVLLTSETLYFLVRVAGAGYLAYLGITTLRSVWRSWRATNPDPVSAVPAAQVAVGSVGSRDSAGPSAPVTESAEADPAEPAYSASEQSESTEPTRPRHQSVKTAYLMGVVSNLLNVKVIIFYFTFLPQFVAPGPGAPLRTATLAVIFISLAVAWWIFYILLLDRVRRWLARPAVERSIEAATGVVLVLLGIKLALDW